MGKNTVLPQSNNGQITFDLTISQGDIKQEYAKLLVEYQQKAEIKGFRKGKAPLRLVEQSLEKSQIYARVLDQLFPKAYSAKIIQEKLSPLIDPQVKPKAFEESKDWVFEVTTVVKPEVILGDYKQYVKKALEDHTKSHEKDAKLEKNDHTTSIVFNTLLKEVKVELSPLLVEQETKSRLSHLVKQLQELKISVADFAKSQKKTQEELVAEYRKSAETELKLELILDKLVEVENPTVSSEDIAKLKPPKGQKTYAKYIIQKQKVLDFLRSL